MFINYAHRGASAYMPENTFSAFYLSLFQNANGIETDVRKTKDGVLVLFHDSTIDRVSQSTGEISNYSYNELLDIRIENRDSGFKDKIVTLEDFLKYFKDQQFELALELKSSNIEEQSLALLKKYSFEDRTVITSFEAKYLTNVRKLNSQIRLGYLIREINDDVWKFLDDICAYQVCPKSNIIDRGIINKAKERGLNIRAWGVSDIIIMKELYDMGVDGMTVNFPDKLKDLMDVSL